MQENKKGWEDERHEAENTMARPTPAATPEAMVQMDPQEGPVKNRW